MPTINGEKIVISDEKMPGMSGSEFLSAVKELKDRVGELKEEDIKFKI